MFICSYKDGRKFRIGCQRYGNKKKFADAASVAAWCLGRQLNEIKIEKVQEIKLPENCCDVKEIEKFLTI